MKNINDVPSYIVTGTTNIFSENFTRTSLGKTMTRTCSYFRSFRRKAMGNLSTEQFCGQNMVLKGFNSDLRENLSR